MWAGGASNLCLWVMGSYQRVVDGDRDNQKLFSPPVTDVLNMLPQASPQAKVVGLCFLFMSLGASGEMEKRFFFLSSCSRDTPNVCRAVERDEETELGPPDCRQR